MIRTATWQDAINAVQILALYRNASFADTAANVRLWRGFTNAKRQLPYSGTPLHGWDLTEQERVPQFQLLSKNQKQLVSFALVVLVVIAANSFPQLWRAVPVYQQSAIVSFIDLLFRSGLVVGAVELFHKMTKQ